MVISPWATGASVNEIPLEPDVDRVALHGGGFAATDADAPETRRPFVPDDPIWVSWDDLYSQQMRDIALIFIGTLIGIGVTVMIKGLRPLSSKVFASRLRSRKSPKIRPTRHPRIHHDDVMCTALYNVCGQTGARLVHPSHPHGEHHP